MHDIWANSDYPYMCLRDRERTELFRRAIEEVVEPGDHVLEIGAGSGILSLFACAAGADRVTAVEVAPELAERIVATAAANGMDDRLTVLTGDARDLDLPKADVVIAEIIDTGLLDEQQLPVMNGLVERGVIGDATRVLPAAYRTELQLVAVDETMYGFTIKALRHEWPFYRRDDNWARVDVERASDPVVVWAGVFAEGPHPTRVERRVQFDVTREMMVNGLRVAGVMSLSPTIEAGAFDSLNGDKIVPLPERTVRGSVELNVSYEMGGGLGSLRVNWV